MDYQPSTDRYGKMQYKLCGNSGLLLPRISLGLWHNFGSVDDFGVATDMIKYAFDHGVTHFDLANNYGPVPGSAESNFGKILKDNFQGYRDEMVISSKAGHEMWAGPYGNGSSRKNLMASIDQSLRRTGLDNIRKGVHQGSILSPCLFNLYAENTVQNAGLSEAQLDSRLLEEISTTSDMQRTPLNWQKVMRTKEPLDECERE